MKKKIWIMNHYSIGMLVAGGGRHYWIAEELKKNGYEPVVFGCNQMHNSIGSYFPDNCIWQEQHSETGVVYIPIKSTQYSGNGISRVNNMLFFAMNLIKTAKQYAALYGAPDLIYASSVHPLTILAGEWLSKKFHVPCIGEVRDLWPETLVAYGAVRADTWLAKILYNGEKRMYAKADAMIFTMEGAPDYICEHKWDTGHGGPINLSKVFHINNGVDLEQFDRNATTFILPDPDLDDPTLFCAVYTGAIKRANNLELLLQTVLLLRDINNLRVLVWGEGNEVEQLKRHAQELELSDRFIIKGYIEKKYIPSILVRSDLNLMHWERTSVNKYGYDYNKLFEYLAAGKPIFSTIQSGHSLLVNQHCGIETSGAKVQDFAAGIRNIYEMDIEERARWGSSARHAASDYDFKTLTSRLINIVESL